MSMPLRFRLADIQIPGHVRKVRPRRPLDGVHSFPQLDMLTCHALHAWQQDGRRWGGAQPCHTTQPRKTIKERLPRLLRTSQPRFVLAETISAKLRSLVARVCCCKCTGCYTKRVPLNRDLGFPNVITQNIMTTCAPLIWYIGMACIPFEKRGNRTTSEVFWG